MNDLRSLIHGVVRGIPFLGATQAMYRQYVMMYENRVGKEPTGEDLFMAGYMLANPVLRDEFKKEVVERQL